MDDIEILLTRGVEKIYPSSEELHKVLRSGKKLKLYQGFDPTGTQLHIGHMIGLRKLRQWQDLGHHVIFLIGDFTAMVGDPSGKSSSRKMLSHEEVLQNAKTYKEQASRIILFSGVNAAEVKFNGEWLGKLNAIELLRIVGHLSYQQVVERDLFQERMKQGQDVYMNEFMYPVMQAYDCVSMDVDLELGGSDQTFNMLMGRKLMRNMIHKDKFVMTLPLLTDAQGKKIGKTEGNAIAITDSPPELYGKIMALDDSIIVQGLESLTDTPLEEIKTIEEKLKAGENPITFKKKLAFEIVKQLNNESSAKTAQEEFERVVQKHELPSEITEITLGPDDGEFINEDFLVAINLVSSKSEAKRLFEQGGVEVDGKRITDPKNAVQIRNNMVVKVGKRKIVRLKTYIRRKE